MIKDELLFWKLDCLCTLFGYVVNYYELREFDESIGPVYVLFAYTVCNSLTLIGFDRKLYLSRGGFFIIRI